MLRSKNSELEKNIGITSFMTEVSTKQKLIHWFALQIMDWFLYDRGFRHERVKYQIREKDHWDKVWHIQKNLILIFADWHICINPFFPMLPFDPPENSRSSLVFWCFQVAQKGTLGRKGLKLKKVKTHYARIQIK